MSWQCKRLPWATKRTNAIHRPRTKAISVLLWFVTSQHAPSLQLLRKVFSRRAWQGKTDDSSITHLSLYHSKPLNVAERTALRKFSRSKVGLFICLLKRHIACWRQSLSMWLPVSFWSEQRLQTKGLFVCLWIYIMNILNIFCKLLKNPKKLNISCLWAGAVESCSSFRRFLCFSGALS